MNLSELEDICRKLEDISVKTQQKIGQVTDLEERSKQLKDEMELEKIRAEIRGEKPPEASSLEELEQARKELKELEGSREALKKDALTGMAKLDLPISKPETDSEGSVVFTLEGGPYDLLQSNLILHYR
jgi:chromosome segregation ATPase